MNKRVREMQYKFAEIQVSDEQLKWTPYVEQSIIDENVIEMNAEAFSIIIDELKQHLTDKQFIVVERILQDRSQDEIAKELNVNQSSVVKCIIGNVDYSDRNNIKPAGGIVRRVPKIILSSDKYRKIIKKLYKYDQST